MQPFIIHVTTVDMGLRFLLLNQLKAIQAAGYRVEGVCAHGPLIGAIQAAGIPVTPVNMTRAITPLHDLVSLVRLVRLFRRLRPTIVHTHNPKPGLVAALAARIAGVPVVIHTLHGFYFHEGSAPRQRLLHTNLAKITASLAHRVLSVNREDTLTAVREHICRAEKIQYLGGGIDLNYFDRSKLDPAQQASLRSTLGIPAEARVIGAVGRLVAEKGYHELFAAVQNLAKTHPDLHVLIVGPEEAEKSDGLTAAVAGDYGISERVHFVGVRYDMPAMYGLMDILAHPSHREGLPFAPMEAAAMSIPVVASDIRGCREIIVHGENGLLVEVKNVAALQAALALLLAAPTLRQAMGRLGRQSAERHFDERFVFQRVMETYATLLAQHGQPQV
jgi:glycosyltransferase involved in cell wall biosynthesis